MEKLKAFIARDSFKMRERIFLLGLLIGFLVLIIGLYGSNPFIVSIAIVIDALTVVYARLAFRCPHCDVFLGTRDGGRNYCPHCGKELDK